MYKLRKEIPENTTIKEFNDFVNKGNEILGFESVNGITYAIIMEINNQYGINNK